MGKLFRFVLWVAVLLGIAIGVLRLTAIRWWQVPSDDPILGASITPTLRAGDWVLLWRATPPKFGALVICPDPEDDRRIVIGRLAGEAGDTLTIDGDRTILNDHEVATETACAPASFRLQDPSTGSDVDQTCTLEVMGGGLHMRGDLIGGEHVEVQSTRTVGQGKVFLESDNRAYPYDSRDYGTVDRNTCKESVFFRLVSKDGFFDEASRLTYIQ